MYRKALWLWKVHNHKTDDHDVRLDINTVFQGILIPLSQHTEFDPDAFRILLFLVKYVKCMKTVVFLKCIYLAVYLFAQLTELGI